ncbi:hypothetical protein EXIGLDRAFT_733938 [Exidia glandulosa HHB12029]|uniref:Uncharacterized protein n=1 Tax=Exidia glandulosa HHB12029 TaxID=1314781 RepID=A0A165KC26_EXIGL|nr:hypothetical protein EXIGLDRAFT_733938 [Exidia glandulosa HHB12029]
MQTGKGAAHFRSDTGKGQKQRDLCASVTAFPHGTVVTFGPRKETDAAPPQVIKREASKQTREERN